MAAYSLNNRGEITILQDKPPRKAKQPVRTNFLALILAFALGGLGGAFYAECPDDVAFSTYANAQVNTQWAKTESWRNWLVNTKDEVSQSVQQSMEEMAQGATTWIETWIDWGD